MESRGTDGVFFLRRNSVSVFALGSSESKYFLPDLCSASERSKQVSIKERGSLVIYCCFGPSATLNVTAFVLVCLMSVRMSDLFKSVLICASYVCVAMYICVCMRLHACVRGSGFD